ncbi:sensor domain-containing diguanylate cyclase [Chiayiivirga flava]|uniref:diguanylate cyclase n=1 Tax=Chiayiivirga flava TaxID=659595 RepID=A0A7W8G179_9GAMM|nr:diguanylate cyclase [Chiayiivirga flava]MBB5208583.1 diguanylate cyclase (GGDEF)-like protein [Chiayiivirga flava]
MKLLRAGALACLLLLGACPDADARVLLDAGTPPVLDLTPATQVLENADHAADLDAVRAPGTTARFRALAPGETTFGYAQGAYWFRFEVENTLPEAVRRVLVIDYALLDHVTLFRIDAAGTVTRRDGGDRTPFATRDLADRHLNFLVDFAPRASATFYLRVESQSSMQVPLLLADPRAYLAGQLTSRLLLGLYYGILVALTLYNLLLFASVRDGNFLWYALYGASYCLMLLCLNGLAFQHLWPQWPHWGNLATLLSVSFSMITVMQFSRRFLDLARRAPLFDLLLRLCMAFALALALAALVAPYSVVIRLQTLLSLAVAPVILIAAFGSMRSYAPARQFALAWSILLIGTMIYAAVALGILPKVPLTEYSIQIGSAAEMILLSLALAYRINALTAENERIQREARSELESRVQARTADLDAALQHLEDANRRLDDFSRRDGLTGLYNRRHLDDALARVCRDVDAQRTPMALMMIDIDHFKSINDRYGHSVGDACLRATAAALSQAVANDDAILARYGGEEFAIVLPHIDADAAMAVAERVRAGIEQRPILTDPHRVDLTISIGLHIVPTGTPCEAQDLLRRADARLYAAKRGGRNRIEISTYGASRK